MSLDPSALPLLIAQAFHINHSPAKRFPIPHLSWKRKSHENHIMPTYFEHFNWFYKQWRSKSSNVSAQVDPDLRCPKVPAGIKGSFNLNSTYWRRINVYCDVNAMLYAWSTISNNDNWSWWKRLEHWSKCTIALIDQSLLSDKYHFLVKIDE